MNIPRGEKKKNEPSIILSFQAAAAAAAKSLQSCPTLCDPIDSPPGSDVPGTLQARTLEWVAIAFSNAWKWKGKVQSLSRVRLLATPWTAAHQAPLSMGFSRREHWGGCHCLLHSFHAAIRYSLDNYKSWWTTINWFPCFHLVLSTFFQPKAERVVRAGYSTAQI